MVKCLTLRFVKQKVFIHFLIVSEYFCTSITGMNSRYKKTKLMRQMWLVLAIFFFIFGSSPVKKFIRSYLNGQHPPVESAATDRLSQQYVKDCSLIERHTISSINSIAAVHDIADYDMLFVLSACICIAGALGLLSSNIPLRQNSNAPPLTLDAIPVYLQYRRLLI